MGLNLTAEALADYSKAVRLGKRDGDHPAVLDDILKSQNIIAPREIPLGLVQIPMEQLAGTKTSGRSTAFSKNFYPVLKETTEFASKWMELYKAHLNEGIRDPIKAYEFMNKFYVEEGNKRVSVLKFFGAVSVPGIVTRIVPPRSREKENRIYYEFMDFYSLSGINYIWFSQIGSFAKLQHLVGKRPDEMWSDDDKLNFSSAYTRFSAEYEANGGKKLAITPGDAFLYFIKLYDYSTLEEMTSAELKEKLTKAWAEFELLTTDESVELQMDPTAEGEVKKNIFARLIPLSTPKQHVAFIHEKTAETSGWTYAHELGRMHLQQTFEDQISTTCYDNATEENADELLAKAIADGNNLIFTTSPPLLKASLKAAIDHPQVKILNCSLNTSHRYIRTYYARMYEAKFLMGAIAGAMSENGKIGYVADYPIFGMTANINAFALGAKMVNPRAKVYLEWSTLKDNNITENFAKNNVHYISGQDMIIPGEASRHFGLYRADEESPLNLAMPIWHWGKFYEHMIRNIMSGSWKYDDTSDNTKGLNYWWGMSSDMIDVICSHHLPIGTIRLVNLLKQTICSGDFNPFSGVLYSQHGVVQKDPEKIMDPEEIIRMDWLAENVVGFIPKMEDLIDKAKPVVLLQGIDNPEI
ncbi:MAG: BMP family ABC transporter substrate-binding protein [Clostridiales bacterium]|nr:BMP family ABC transporter substrate-binding protein [Clostridiales bacterium]